MSDDAESQQKRLRFKKIISELSEMKGMGTELVTVIIPPEKEKLVNKATAEVPSCAAAVVPSLALSTVRVPRPSGGL